MAGSSWGLAFLAGLLTPLGAVCVLPLYPGYVAFLAGPGDAVAGVWKRVAMGLITAAGILASMLLFGLVVVLILSYPISRALWILSPLAYLILGIIGLLLILDLFPEFTAPVRLPGGRMPFIGALLFGLFFGVLVLPCNVAPIAILLALSTSTSDLFANLLNFLFFGIGMAMPLIVISGLSGLKGNLAAAFLTRHKRAINLVTGFLMVVVALYYLLIVFRIQAAVF